MKAQGPLKYKGSEEEGRKVADEYLLGNYISDNIMSFSKPLFKKLLLFHQQMHCHVIGNRSSPCFICNCILKSSRVLLTDQLNTTSNLDTLVKVEYLQHL